jgi:predicted amidophosphoribosyltransferase
MAQGIVWLGLQPLEWLVSKPCPLCRQPLPPGDLLRAPLCASCAGALMLPHEGLHGTSPLPWWAAGPYVGAYRRILLDLRHRPHQKSVAALLRGVTLPTFPHGVAPLMVPVPSWKKRANPLPGLICRMACRKWRCRGADLLRRSRPVLGQHHLNRAMRMENQKGAFTCLRPPKAKESWTHPLILVDDILTSGATALSATETLRQAGWRVQGLICLARTPVRCHPTIGDLRSEGRESDRPG